MDGQAPRTPAPAADHTLGWAIFPTELGECAIAWGAEGLTGTALPEDGASSDGMAGYLLARYPGIGPADPPGWVDAAIDRIRAVLAGRSDDDLADLPLDQAGVSEFAQQVYRLARAVPPGETTTYGAIAGRLGGPVVARAVGRALGDNPFPIVVPCHRVTAADGAIGGFSAPGGARTKRRMLLVERAGERDDPGLFGAADLY